MKKTISITLNGIVFNIEEDTFAELQVYLEALKNHFGSSAFGKEVIVDIEARFAEQFSSTLKDRKTETISIDQVQEIIKNMGTVADLTNEEKTSNQDTPRATGQRRLYRNPEDVVISGVSSGMASYFNIDPLIPRILFVVSALIGGYGILLYILLWIIVPKAESNSQKLEMKGDAVNIANLEENHRGRQNKTQNFSMIRYFFRELFYLMGRFIRTLGPILISIIGILITAATFVALFAGTLLMLLLCFDPNSPYIDPAITQVFNGSEYVFLISSGFVSGFIPLLTILLVGISFIRRKNTFTKPLFITMAVLWFAAGLTFGFLATSAAPQIDAAVKSIEARPEASKEFSVSEFQSIQTERDERVKISYGTQTKVIAYGREEELDDLIISVENNELNFEYNDDFRICIFCINKPTTFEVITPYITKVDAANFSRVDIHGFNGSPEFEINAHNTARVMFDGQVSNISVDLNNAARVILSGKATNLNATLTNASRLEAMDFVTENITIEATNSSDAEVNVTSKIQATASGASHVRYTGNPDTKELDESNAARITEN